MPAITQTESVMMTQRMTHRIKWQHSFALTALALAIGAQTNAAETVQTYNPSEGFAPMLVVPTRPDLLNPATNNTQFASRFLIGNAGSVGTFGNTTSLGGFTGVGGLTIRTATGGSSCTGSLISSTIVLTAAHCLTGALTSITFNNPSNRPANLTNQINPGPLQSTAASGYLIHQNYDLTSGVAGGYDVALIRLATPLTNIATYGIYRGTNERFVDHIKVGAGSSGWGLVGNDSTTAGVNNTGRGEGFFDGRKRGGYNQYEAYGQAFFDAVTRDPLTASGLVLGGPSDSVLVYDFDSGNIFNDVFGNLDVYSAGAARDFYRQQTGVQFGGQNWEANASPGDSGGPTFVLDTDNIWKVAGITSFGITGGILDGICGGYNQITGVHGGSVSPVSGRPALDTSGRNTAGACNDSSWGEIGGDTRVSSFAQWIDFYSTNTSAFTTVPLPSSVLLLGLGLLGILRSSRK
jgi:Trypsin/PEP-CTERM motif